MKFQCTGVILAGGANSRLPGKKKTFHPVGGEPMFQRLYRLFNRLFEETLILVNDPGDFADWDVEVVTDISPLRCALAGLHAGLFYASYPFAYVSACDVPFASEAVIRHAVGQAKPGTHVVIPRTPEGMEPLSAVYSKACIPLIEENLDKRIYMIKRFFNPRKVVDIPPETLRQLDPAMQFMFNVNTPEDLEKAEKMADPGKPNT
ncbi:MAG: molybdenum cofactor guanylyltransferase [Desulfobacterales bacterium]|nr:molybdenum cofactor guanylyltransferase [Desulfobacterales bacterium]